MKKLCVNRVSKRLLVALLTFAVLATALFSMPVYAAENDIVMYDLPVAEEGYAYTYDTSIVSSFNTGNNGRFGMTVNATQNWGNPEYVMVTLQKQTIVGFRTEKTAKVYVGESKTLIWDHPVDKNTNYRILYKCARSDNEIMTDSSVKIYTARSVY